MKAYIHNIGDEFQNLYAALYLTPNGYKYVSSTCRYSLMEHIISEVTQQKHENRVY